MSTPWIDHYTPAQRAVYGHRMRAKRQAEAERAAARRQWGAANPPAYCMAKHRDAEGVLRYFYLIHKPGHCDGCDRAREAGMPEPTEWVLEPAVEVAR